ncbi:thiosulfate/3-mercaptopyruvate sulfurtransferase [Scopulibacillus darangshiensis]|uniref:Thiosulfate/3-mercaptopyruvate sulfurtransferase n=1 Tax=Scopulibacillus darangshiensis TaxID=442528 RepID=A0A4R2P4R6_9BACL|nr:sulfurtransferase [Scopulibacillus darangshiensis]TCP29810.1 thiosulfate/3-mercaptopyruvate sulfurtransferase [Scopulibacillus darangshiensis]
MKTTIDMNWVKDHIDDENIVIADCRFNLQDPREGRRQYNKAHLPHAVYFDLEKDLSRQATRHGGRHPLPDVKDLAFKLGNSGVDHRKTVIAYDDQGGAFAARLWWLLNYFGHDKVLVMDEGFSAWHKEGYPVENDRPAPHPTQFVPKVHNEMIVTHVDVCSLLENKDNVALIDSRARSRYLGEEEPMDAKAGHIPGAENWFWKENLTPEGKWKTEPELKNRFASLENKKSITVYCGSGVTACPNILGLQKAGFTNVKLYPGSWSDWISYEEYPIAKGAENKNG